MNAELAIHTSPDTASLADKVEYAKALAPADLLPPAFRGKPANVLLAMEAGQSLGKTAIEIMQNAHVISGKLGFSAEFQRALVLESGHRFRVFMDGETAVAQGVRSDDPNFTYESRWDLARAKAAELTTGPNKANWAKMPHSMLKARATTEVCRDGFADVIRGYRSVDELREIAPDAPVIQIRPGDKLRAAAGLPVEPVEEIHDTEVIDADEPEELRPITPDQLKKMHTMFTRLKFDREQGLNFISQTLGFAVESSKDVTLQEASDVISALEALEASGGE